MNKEKVFIVSLGCPRNSVDSQILVASVIESGKYEIVFEPKNADHYVINTCAFIGPAVEESIEHIGEALKLRKKGIVKNVIVTGCLAERFKDDPEYLRGIDLIRGIDLYDDPGTFFRKKDKFIFGSRDRLYAGCPRAFAEGEHYAYLKIAEGCSRKCAFCLIPEIKGKLRSKTVKEVLREAEELQRMNITELILIAQDTTDYGKDISGRSALLELLSQIDKCGFKWVRVHYMNPDTTDRRFVEKFMSFNTILPYFDIPLQHVSPRILKLMRRPCDMEELKMAFRLIKDSGGEIRTSFITGYPSETEAEHDMVKGFLEEFSIGRCAVFPFFDENNLVRSLNLEPVPPKTASKRIAELEEIITNMIYLTFPESRKEKVIVDGFIEGAYRGRTFRDSPGIDLSLKLKGKGIKKGDIVKAVLKIKDGEFIGEV